MKKYDEEFKKIIVEFLESGSSRNELSLEYGVSLATISSWKKQYGTVVKKDFIEDKDYKKLKKEISRLAEENAVLKKCISIFSEKR